MTTEIEAIKRPSISGLKIKEEADDRIIYTGLVATTHPDRARSNADGREYEGDILSEEVIDQIVDHINDKTRIAGPSGAFRSVSLYHDWIHQGDPSLDEAAFVIPPARKVKLDDGHYGAEVDVEINKFYKGNLTPEEINYRIQKDSIAGLSIEYKPLVSSITPVNLGGKLYRFIGKLAEYGGQALARARMIANPSAVFYKEIEAKTKEANINTGKIGAQESKGNMSEENKETKPQDAEQKPEESQSTETETPSETSEPTSEPSNENASSDDSSSSVENKEIKSTVEPSTDKKMSMKEMLESKEFKELVAKEVEVKSKVLLQEKEKMAESLMSVKELNDQISTKEFDAFSYKQVARRYLKENEIFEKQLRSTGIPLVSTMEVKCEGNKLRIVSKFETKDTLDTGTNTSSYTQNIVEFADVYTPVLVDTFNNQTNLFGQMPKRDHIEGGNKYGWRIKTVQQSSLSVDPDDTSVNKAAVKKLKLQTDIKEYRLGVSVSDYTLHHSRGSIGDLFMVEVESTMRDIMKDINSDLFTEQADGDGTKILGLEAVADSAGNTTLYGLTRSTANRLAPDAAADTYQAIGGAISTAKVREAATAIEKEGANRANIRYIVNPDQRDALFELEDGLISLNSTPGGPAAPRLGFSGELSYDGIPIIVDSDCQADALFAVDFESYHAVISRAPQLIGLAKVGAAEEAYISVYLAVVYEQPRRVHMLDTLS